MVRFLPYNVSAWYARWHILENAKKSIDMTYFIVEQDIFGLSLLGMLMKKAKEDDYAIVITSDHGNCEEMCDGAGHKLTNHTVGDVWCFVIADGVTTLKSGGSLSNIAPTVLKIMGLNIPKEMDEALF